MITEREKKLLQKLIVENSSIPSDIIDELTDEDIYSNFSLLTSSYSFCERKRYKDFIMKNKDIEGSFETLYFNNYECKIPLPLHLSSNDLLKLLENEDFRKYMSKSDFTRNYFHVINSPDTARKYKDCIDFNTLIYSQYNLPDTVVEVLYEDLYKIYSDTILYAIKFNTERPYLNNLLIHKIENKSNLKNNINSNVLDNLLEFAKLSMTNNPEILNKYLFDNFDDKFIIENIDKFDYYKILYSGRLSEDIYQTIIDKIVRDDERGRYFDFIDRSLKKYNFSKEFLLKNVEFLRSMELYYQKEIMYLYDKVDWIKAEDIFLLNDYITNDNIIILMEKSDPFTVFDHKYEKYQLSKTYNYRISDYIKFLKGKENE